MRFRASHVAAATGGMLEGPDVELEGASFDTRTLRPGELFVPIVAARDGHDFIGAALAAGAGATLASRAVTETIPTITVADTGAALMELAGWGRTRLAATVVGITGSVGKTSTKDLIRAAVAPGRRVVANERSYNNEQGLPVTVLGAPDDTEVLVLEMGMRGFGEIRRLCDIARPAVGVVTAVAPSHTAARRRHRRCRPGQGRARRGAAAVRHGDPQRRRRAGRGDGGTDGRGHGDVRPRRAAPTCASPTSGSTPSPGRGSPPTRRGGPSRSRSASAGGTWQPTPPPRSPSPACSVSISLRAADALGRAELSAMRMQLVRAATGGLVINDAYNANPTSMAAALEALAAVEADRRVAVLGLMAELDDPVPAHRAIAARAGELGIELIAVDTDGYGIAPIAGVDVVRHLGRVGPGVAVLVKASRAAGLEAVAAQLTGP